jgi:hypothetical protein
MVALAAPDEVLPLARILREQAGHLATASFCRGLARTGQELGMLPEREAVRHAAQSTLRLAAGVLPWRFCSSS